MLLVSLQLQMDGRYVGEFAMIDETVREFLRVHGRKSGRSLCLYLYVVMRAWGRGCWVHIGRRAVSGGVMKRMKSFN